MKKFLSPSWLLFIITSYMNNTPIHASNQQQIPQSGTESNIRQHNQPQHSTSGFTRQPQQTQMLQSERFHTTTTPLAQLAQSTQSTQSTPLAQFTPFTQSKQFIPFAQSAQFTPFTPFTQSKQFIPFAQSAQSTPLAQSTQSTQLVQSTQSTPLARFTAFTPLARSKQFTPLTSNQKTIIQRMKEHHICHNNPHCTCFINMLSDLKTLFPNPNTTNKQTQQPSTAEHSQQQLIQKQDHLLEALNRIYTDDTDDIYKKMWSSKHSWISNPTISETEHITHLSAIYEYVPYCLKDQCSAHELAYYMYRMVHHMENKKNNRQSNIETEVTSIASKIGEHHEEPAIKSELNLDIFNDVCFHKQSLMSSISSIIYDFIKNILNEQFKEKQINHTLAFYVWDVMLALHIYMSSVYVILNEAIMINQLANTSGVDKNWLIKQVYYQDDQYYNRCIANYTSNLFPNLKDTTWLNPQNKSMLQTRGDIIQDIISNNLCFPNTHIQYISNIICNIRKIINGDVDIDELHIQKEIEKNKEAKSNIKTQNIVTKSINQKQNIHMENEDEHIHAIGLNEYTVDLNEYVDSFLNQWCVLFPSQPIVIKNTVQETQK